MLKNYVNMLFRGIWKYKAFSAINITGLVASIDGKTVIQDTLSGPAESSETIGLDLAENLISKGAQKIIASLIEDLE